MDASYRIARARAARDPRPCDEIAMSTLEVEGRTISFVRDGALSGRPLFVCAHGAGAPYTSPFMAHVAKQLAARGICVVRFHFPYMEDAARTGTRKPPDRAPLLLSTWRAIISTASKMRGHGPLAIGGKSMGGRIASMLLAEGGAPEARAAVYLGYPLHPPGRPEKLRADHLPAVPVPQLFVQGEKDDLCDPRQLRGVLATIPRAEHLEIAGADHSLARSRRDALAASAEWLDAVAQFLVHHAG
jgi:predicted alpha/beta-hydrolase family hydrolase